MKRWEVIWKNGDKEDVNADIIQPSGAAICFLRLGNAVDVKGQSSAELVRIVNFDEVRSIERKEVLN